nr:hypothetical protein [Tanacetum cinerariifolium]
TGGLRDKEKEGSLHLPALHLNKLPGVQAGLLQGLNLDSCLPVSLLLQRNLCRLPVRWRNPHIRCLRQKVYKVMTDQLDWDNPEGQQYPHNLLQPLPLIPDNRGRRVIPFEHFINNDLEYLWGGASSRKYTTYVTKTKAADYGHIKWIEDLVPRAMWIQEPINYDKHALWGFSHWGRKRQQFYEFAVNRESALDVYSKRRIIAGIRMQYFPTTIWRKEDKDRAAAMIEAIDKMLKTRRIMRSLEMFVGGRQYEGDFRMLQRTI